MSRKQHWETIYSTKSDSQLSWTQPNPQVSLALIAEAASSGKTIDIGGGTSPLAGLLLEKGYGVTILDISEPALARARQLLGTRAEQVQWICADITQIPEIGTFDIWHDRAVFHFLTDPADRAAYVALLLRSLPINRHAIISTFAPDGPEQCSGLPVVRYDGSSLLKELGNHFRLIRSVPEMHQTPWGKQQSFQYSLLLRT